MTKNTAKIESVPPLYPPCPSLGGDKNRLKNAVYGSKNKGVPTVPDFSNEIKSIKEKVEKGGVKGRGIAHIYNNREKGGDTQGQGDKPLNVLQKYPQLEHPEICELIRYLRELHGLPKSTEGIRKLEIKYRHNGDDLWACINRIIFGDNRPVEQVNRYCPEYILTHKGQRPAVRCNGCRRARCKTEVRPSECPGLPVIDERLNCYEWMPQVKERVRTNPHKREAIMDKTALFISPHCLQQEKDNLSLFTDAQ